MQRAIVLLFVGNVVALEHQIGGIDSYSKTTTAASPVQIEMVQSIHDSAPPWDATAVDEEEILLLKNDLIVASPTPLTDGEGGHDLKRPAETTPMSTNSGYIVEIRSDDEAGEATLFPRQVETFLSPAGSLRATETTSTNDAPETSTDSESTSSLPSIASSASAPESQSPSSTISTTSLPPTQSSTETRTATGTSPAPTSASTSQSEEAPAGSTPAPLSSNSETAATSSDVEPTVSSPGDQSESPAAPSTIAIRASTTLPPSPITQPVIPLPGTTLTPNSAAQFVADNQTLIPGGSAISISGNTVSLDSSATELVVGGTSTISVIPTTVYQSPQPPTISLAGTALTLNPATGYVAGTQTLIAGGPAITILNTTISLAPSATEIVVDSTSTVNLVPTTVYQTPQPPAISLAGTTLTPNSASEYVAGTQTLIPGGPVVTVLNTAISLAPSATEIIIDSTSTISLAPTTVYQTPQPPAIPLEGTTLTLTSVSEYVVGTQTLVPGGPVITILGTAVSLDPSATAIVVSEISTNRGASGFTTRGPSGVPTRNVTVTATTILEPYTGVASNNKADGFGWWILAILVVVHVFMN